jgi:hypothetical protein
VAVPLFPTRQIFMAITGSYNGASIIALPSSPAPKQIQLDMNNIVAAPTNPFTGSTMPMLL